MDDLEPFVINVGESDEESEQDFQSREEFDDQEEFQTENEEAEYLEISFSGLI